MITLPSQQQQSYAESMQMLEAALTSYIAQMEIDLIKENHPEQADPQFITGDYILNLIQAETDLLDRVAARVKAGMQQAQSTNTNPNTDPSDFQQQALLTKFAIETSQGFWNRTNQCFYQNIANSSTFDWLEQDDMLTECMEEIAGTPLAWFRIITVTPFTNHPDSTI